MDYVGLYGLLSAAFEAFFTSFRFAIGGRYLSLVHDLVWGVLGSGSTVVAEIARAYRAGVTRPLIYDEKRLTGVLASPGWDDQPLADALTRYNAREPALAGELKNAAESFGEHMESDLGRLLRGTCEVARIGRRTAA